MSLEPRRPRAPREIDRLAWIDGEIRQGGAATLSVFDRGARDGEGLFETLTMVDGHPCRWRRHLERLVVSAAELGFPVPPSPRVLRQGLAELAEVTGLSSAVARITITRGIPSGGRGRRTRVGAWIELDPLEARLWRGTRSGGARLVMSRRSFEPGPLGRHKTTSRLAYSLAREEARAARADETLLVSPSGWVLEGAVSNLFLAKDGRVSTPPLSLGILPGITRADVLRLCAERGMDAGERLLSRADLEDADEIFVTSSVQGVVPVAELEGVPRPADGPLARSLRDAHAADLDDERLAAARRDDSNRGVNSPFRDADNS
ncbi:MAG: hypothetical protein E6K80_04740 [Candidatus Eisenbacteria bacterium]|uniref:Aminodeoxychorismate lyase n=1 Tax=Eiseniibacteriota bacterium TaxID=2212470 RepID=A0A538U768_UNCEI|nr:MAG: hypothetical protein E6K80_04740 [Candidatus Eisenbacteria bacterium]